MSTKILPPFNLQDWINKNRHILKPPVGNKNLYVDAGDFIVMIVAGPNARKDYHYNETEELFFQLEGDIIVKTQQNKKMVEVKIKEGEMFLLPAKIPHSPVRPKGSIGLVIERKRDKNDKDGLQKQQMSCCMRSIFISQILKKTFYPYLKGFILMKN